MTSLTQEQKAEIERLYKLKVLNKNIAKFLGISPHIVNNYLYKEYLLTHERAKYTCSHMEKSDEVLNLYKKGEPYKKISEITGLPYYHICDILKLTTLRRREGITIKNLREVQRMLSEGYRVSEISYKLDISYGKAEYWVKKIRSGVYTSLH
jgi:DNA-binding CsgD family transcriptional regulator